MYGRNISDIQTPQKIMAPKTQICGNCSTVNDLAAQFCANCGYALANGPVDRTVLTSSSQATVVSSMASVAGVVSVTSRRITGALSAGSLLEGRYSIVDMIGKGGFGAVYKAEDKRLAGRIVAIKEMSDAQLPPAEKVKVLQDFKKEAELLVKLKHPNLPSVSDFFEEAGKAYLVMEFVEGKTLNREQDDRNVPLDENLVLGWALQLCLVLQYLHTRPQPIIFRDMKPSNIMVTAEGEIKLIDFGIARIFKTTGKKDTSLLGSQGYAPLEQYGRGQSDARSDVYALGATLFDLLTKEVPVDSPSRRVNPTLFVTPRQLNASISPVVEMIVLKAMAEEPAARYQTVAEMYEAIVATGLVTNMALPLGVISSGLVSNQITSGSVSYVTTPPALLPQLPSSGGIANPGMATGGVPSYVSPSSPRSSRRAFLIGGVVAGLAAIGGGVYFFTSRPLGLAGTITLNFTFSTEKEEWLTTVINDFNSSNTQYDGKLIQVQMDARGSWDATTRILSGDIKPTIWSPASDLEINQLVNKWKQSHSKDILFTSGELRAQSLVLSPLVFAIWKDRHDVFLKKYPTVDWSSIHDALQLPSWDRIGGQGSWGAVKLGQTRPDSSNSGLLSIALLAYSYYQGSRALSVDKIRDVKFLQYLADVEGAVTKFGRSSGTYLEREIILQGPSGYDIVPTYENLVLTCQRTAVQRQGQPLIASYPTLNIVSNHPFAILTSASPEEQQAAKKFRDFLLAAPQQRKALLTGFRPVNLDVSITDSVANNPFNDTATLGFKPLTQLPTQVQSPSGDVVDELIAQWMAKYQSAPTALSLMLGQIQRTM